MNTGPEVKDGFDLAITEVDGAFVVEIGSPRGADVISKVESKVCALHEVEAARAITKKLTQEMQDREHQDTGECSPRARFLDTSNIRELLLSNLDHPRWSNVAERCLTCGNCTLVCPTCFCAAIEEVSDLSGNYVRRERAWDSCFTAEHSYMNTGVVRKSTFSRYRQWLTHKLATWIDQFGTTGCVGCGRCITWCPVAIDITEEVAAIRSTDGAGRRDSVKTTGLRPMVSLGGQVS
jgi:ferredoxin